MRHLRSAIVLALLGPLGPSVRAPEPPPKVVVLSIDLNNIHKSAPDSSLAGRIARLGEALRARLATACGYEIVPVDSVAEATAHDTDDYFYEHPEVAVGLARGVGADWVAWPDKTSVDVGFARKGPSKSQVALQHLRLPDRAAATRMKEFWAERLRALEDLLATG